jgi:hypothetical protein
MSGAGLAEVTGGVKIIMVPNIRSLIAINMVTCQIRSQNEQSGGYTISQL